MINENITFDAHVCKRYFETVFPDVGENLISVCTKAPRGLQSRFFRLNNGTVLSAIERLAQREDVWTSVCCFAHRPQEGRGTEADVAMMTGLWLDIDVKEGKHAKGNLPTLDEALQFIKSLPWTPSLIIFSGGGLHVYYLFKEPQVIESEDDRVALKSLSERFQKYVICRMKERGWQCDSTFDLARVLRPAGTLNYKTDPPVPVTIMEESDARYEPDDFEVYLPQGETRNSEQRSEQEATGVSKPQAFDVERLPFATKELIRNGTEPGRRSEATASVIVAFVKAGASDEEIIATFEANPQGIGQKFFEKGGGRVKWLRDEITRCRVFSSKRPDEWPEPVPIIDTLPPVLPLQDEMIPSPFLPMVKDESRRMSVPPDYIAVPLIVVCGSLIGTGCRIKPKRRDDWAVVPNLWGGLIGPPSRLKTPAMETVVKKLLGRLEAEAAEEHRSKMLLWADDKRKAELSKSVLEQEFKAALKSERNGKGGQK
jgi:hypothetical protein